MDDETLKAICAMLCLCALGVTALIIGVDGAILTAVSAAIGALGGIAYAKKKIAAQTREIPRSRETQVDG